MLGQSHRLLGITSTFGRTLRVMSKVSPRCVCVGGIFYYTTEAASLIKGEIYCWDIRGKYATKSTVAECVKWLCLGCVDELLAAFLEFPGVDGEAG